MHIWDVVKVEACFTSNVFPFGTAESSVKPPWARGVWHSGPVHTGPLQCSQILSCDFDCPTLPGRLCTGVGGISALGLGSWEPVGAGNSRERTKHCISYPGALVSAAAPSSECCSVHRHGAAVTTHPLRPAAQPYGHHSHQELRS